MKKLLQKTVICMLLCLLCPETCNTYRVFAENDVYLDSDALLTAQCFIDSEIESGLSEWNGYELDSYRELFDFYGQSVGFSIEFEKGHHEAYVIVVDTENGYVVSEASRDTGSPYKNLYDVKCVYYGPFNYYIQSRDEIQGEDDVLYDVLHNNYVDVDFSNDLHFSTSLVSSDSGVSSSALIPDSPNVVYPIVTNVYLSDYSASFEAISQYPSNKRCVPTSFAMAVKYLHNTEQISLSITDNLIIRNKMSQLMCGSYDCMATGLQPKTGIESFTNQYSNHYISTSIYDFEPDTYFSVASGEIDGNYPLILMFHAGVVTSGTSAHATTMVGYRTVENSAYTNEYARVMDPYPETPVERTVLWDVGNTVYGYFILYVY